MASQYPSLHPAKFHCQAPNRVRSPTGKSLVATRKIRYFPILCLLIFLCTTSSKTKWTSSSSLPSSSSSSSSSFGVQAFPPPSTSMTLPKSRSTSGGGAATTFKDKAMGTASSLSLSSSNPLWQAVGIYAGVDLLGFVVSLVTKSHLHLDLLGTGAFCVFSLSRVIWGSGKTSTLASHQYASSLAVSVWAMKLAAFLFWRANQVQHDARLTDTLSTVDGMFGFWFITFLWNVCCSLPYLLGLLSTRSHPVFTKVGGVLFGVGLVVESLADFQKWIFKQGHPGQFCNVGLWSISQHPNFFGNLVLWAGILVMNLPALVFPGGTTMLARYHRVGLALISPLFMWGLFYGQATGVVTNAAQMAMDKYGKDAAYHAYVQQVPLIIPKLFSK